MGDLPWKSIVVSTLTALVAVTLPAVLVIFDIAVFDLDCDERGVVEVAQALMLLTIFALMTVAAFRRPDLRGGLVLIAGFFLDMFIRENDGFLDRIRHGCWIYPALLAAAVAILIAVRYRDRVIPAFARLFADRSFPLLPVGMFVVIGFSRIFGMKQIWKVVVGVDDFRPAKHVAEEGLELLGYSILLLWAVGFFRTLSADGAKSRSGGAE